MLRIIPYSAVQFAAYEEFKKVNCFLFYLVIILSASLQNEFFGVWHNAVLITFEESNETFDGLKTLIQEFSKIRRA